MKNHLKLILLVTALLAISSAFAEDWVACSAGYDNEGPIIGISFYTGCAKGNSSEDAMNKDKAACDSSHCKEVRPIKLGCAAAVAGGSWYMPYQGVGIAKDLQAARNAAYDDAQQQTRNDENYLCWNSPQAFIAQHHMLNQSKIIRLTH